MPSCSAAIADEDWSADSVLDPLYLLCQCSLTDSELHCCLVDGRCLGDVLESLDALKSSLTGEGLGKFFRKALCGSVVPVAGTAPRSDKYAEGVQSSCDVSWAYAGPLGNFAQGEALVEVQVAEQGSVNVLFGAARWSYGQAVSVAAVGDGLAVDAELGGGLPHIHPFRGHLFSE